MSIPEWPVDLPCLWAIFEQPPDRKPPLIGQIPAVPGQKMIRFCQDPVSSRYYHSRCSACSQSGGAGALRATHPQRLQRIIDVELTLARIRTKELPWAGHPGFEAYELGVRAQASNCYLQPPHRICLRFVVGMSDGQAAGVLRTGWPRRAPWLGSRKAVGAGGRASGLEAHNSVCLNHRFMSVSSPR